MTPSSGDQLPWQRWWALGSEPIEFVGGGALPDPGTDVGRVINPELRTLSELGDVPSLVLLGDAGMGKSAELRLERQRLEQAGMSVTSLNLGEYGSVTLIDRAFDKLSVQGGDQEQALLLDGFDEALISASRLPELVARRLKDLDFRFARVRIASRPSARRGRLDEALDELVGRVEVRALAPLTSDDVALAATRRGVDKGKFTEAVAAADAWPLAARPLTLNLLVDTFASDGALPPTRFELYDRQVPSLLAEADGERAVADHAVPVATRQEAAEELAALMVLGGLPTVTRCSAGAPEGALVLETAMAHRLDAAAAVLDSSLMTGVGDALQWTHRTFAEFLTARWLMRLSPDSAFRLLALPHDINTISPPVSGVGGWLAEMSTGFAGLVADRDPLALLGPPVAGLSDAVRAGIVRALLARFEHTPPLRSLDYRGLTYPSMVEDLSDLVRGPQGSHWARREALRMWRDCGVGDEALLMELVEQGVADGASEVAADMAGWALLVLEALPPGPSADRLQELAGNSRLPSVIRTGLLYALHPNRIGLQPFLALFPGALAEEGEVAQAAELIVRELDLTDPTTLGAVARWLVGHPDEAADRHGYRRIAEGVMLRAGGADDADLRALAGDLAARQLRQTHQLLPRDTTRLLGEAGPAERLRLGEALLSGSGHGHLRSAAFALRRCRILRFEDFPAWLDLYEEALGSGDASRQTTIHSILEVLAGPETADAARAAATGRPALDAVIEELFGPDRVQSWDVQRAEEAAYDREILASKQAEMFSISRLDEAISQRAWPAAYGELLRSTLEHPQPILGRLRERPAWTGLDEQHRGACLELALEAFGESPSEQRTPSHSDPYAAVAAFDLLMQAGTPPSAADTRAWLPHVIALGASEEPLAAMVALVAVDDPAFVDETLLAAVAKEAHRNASPLSHVGSHWSDVLQNGLLKIVAAATTSATSVRVILTEIDIHDAPAAIDASLAIVAEAPDAPPTEQTDDRSWDRAVAAFSTVAESRSVAERWDTVQALLTSRADLVAEAIDKIGFLAGQRLFYHLRSDQLADAIRWARSDRSRHEGAPDPVADFGRDLLIQLRNRSTDEAAEQLEILATELNIPHLRSQAVRSTMPASDR